MSGKLIGRLSGHSGHITAMDFDEDGTWIATGSRDGSARLWPTQVENWAHARVPRRLSPDEFERFHVGSATESAHYRTTYELSGLQNKVHLIRKAILANSAVSPRCWTETANVLGEIKRRLARGEQNELLNASLERAQELAKANSGGTHRNTEQVVGDLDAIIAMIGERLLYLDKR